MPVVPPATLCEGCRYPIRDRYIFCCLDKHWHASCICCSDCKVPLSEKCYSRDGKLFCRSDFVRRYGTKCAGCDQPIEKNDLVRRAKERFFHVRCFKCSTCEKTLDTGEQLYIINGSKFYLLIINLRRYGTKCAGCDQPIEKNDLVRRAKERFFHVRCFKCSTCEKTLDTGEQLYIINGSKFYLLIINLRRYGTKCAGCDQPIEKNDLVRRAKERFFHVRCFKCSTCEKTLDTGEQLYIINGSKFYLLFINLRRYGTKCAGCDQPIEKNDLVRRAKERFFHVRCFKCSTCEKTLDTGEQLYIINGSKFYLLFINLRRYGTKCAGCDQPIEKNDLVRRAKERFFHVRCFKCSTCEKTLDTGEQLYIINGSKFYLLIINLRRYGTKCAGCDQPIEKNDLVRRAKERFFHVRCFKCSTCEKTLDTGEQLYIINGRKFYLLIINLRRYGTKCAGCDQPIEKNDLVRRAKERFFHVRCFKCSTCEKTLDTGEQLYIINGSKFYLLIINLRRYGTKCAGCDQPIEKNDLVRRAKERFFHVRCFKCSTCEKTLDTGEQLYIINGSKFYLLFINLRRYGTKCAGCDQPIEKNDLVRRAKERFFHVRCFKCSTCEKTLDTGEQLYIINGSKFYLWFINLRRYGTKCAGCDQPIEKNDLVRRAKERFFHVRCFKCSTCEKTLDTGEQLYIINGSKFYLLFINLRRYGTKCAGCDQPIEKNDLVRRAKERFFHVRCFKCSTCEKTLDTGEQLYIINGSKFYLWFINLRRYGTKCAGCDQPIEKNDLVRRAKERFFHVRCFKCSTCEKTLDTGEQLYIINGSKFYLLFINLRRYGTKCAGCDQPIEKNDLVRRAKERFFHVRCFKCSTCEKTLDTGEQLYIINGSKFYLLIINLRRYGTKCAGCDQPIEKNDLVRRAKERFFHVRCFKCSTCEKTLDTGEQLYIINGSKFYLLIINLRRYGTKCAGCDQPIEKNDLVRRAKERFFHVRCFKCSTCEKTLDTGEQLYIINGSKFYLLIINLRRYGTKCAGCDQPIEKIDLVRRAKERFFHVRCFKCSTCEKTLDTGEQLYIINGSKFYLLIINLRRYGTKCAGCDQPIEKNDLVRRAKERFFHVRCFKCITCEKTLDTGEQLYIINGSKFYLLFINLRRYGTKCAGCDQPIEKNDLVRRAKERFFHVRCFKCSTCEKTLDTGEQLYIINGSKFYLLIINLRRYGTKCAGCDQPIEKNDLVRRAKERFFHVRCFKCSTCEKTLDTGEQLYIINGSKFYLLIINLRRYGTKCAGCDQPIEKNDLVRRAKERFFHVRCFKCSTCEKTLDTGEQLYIINGSKFFCERDYNSGGANATTSSDPGSGAEEEIDEEASNLDDSSYPRDTDSVAHSPKSDETDLPEGMESAGPDDSSGSGPGGTTGGTKRRGPRTTIKAKQLETLKSAFAATPKPTRHIREQLAQETGLNMRVIQVWFQNRRSKERRMKQLRYGQGFRPANRRRGANRDDPGMLGPHPMFADGMHRGAEFYQPPGAPMPFFCEWQAEGHPPPPIAAVSSEMFSAANFMVPPPEESMLHEAPPPQDGTMYLRQHSPEMNEEFRQHGFAIAKSDVW